MILPPPDEITDAQLNEALWQLIHRLAKQRTFLSHTNHLSDRELYTKLWSDALREAKPDMPISRNGGYFIDMVGTGSEEDMQIYYKYYADDEYIERCRKDWPDEKIPMREKPPFDRDRLLPKAGYPFD